ncbi:hypothetical protein KM043_013116 [Ampulex compressa]|nr:hypothetical protein KM043_013116 [Ampulex compressa]
MLIENDESISGAERKAGEKSRCSEKNRGLWGRPYIMVMTKLIRASPSFYLMRAQVQKTVDTLFMVCALYPARDTLNGDQGTGLAKHDEAED